MSKATPITILIVGNGVAGPILAMALKKVTPHKIILVDAGPEEALPIGAALGITPNGLRALRFIDAEHLIVDKGGKLGYVAFRRGDTNTTLIEQPVGDLFTEKYGFADIKPDFANASVIVALSKLTKEEEEELNLKRGFNVHLGSEASFAGFHTADPAGGEAPWGDDHSIEHLTKLAQSKIEGWQNQIPSKVISKTFRCVPTPLYDRQPLATWHKGRVVLCGDAAHPTTPAGGQGSQMAAESAVILARLLAENEPSDELFRRYASIPHSRTDWVTKTSRRSVVMLFVLTTSMWQVIRNIAISLFGGYVFKTILIFYDTYSLNEYKSVGIVSKKE
ncbi:hypothetical protein M408DRAFT_24928 [Serendipita vermifera MAFF 305830]|uniref:FAD-binding domain-containing protein n=1 Tax=Serendipita vermifera MAFF 305830 TaxID=933852 RepID=A0A0C2XCP4_SERVB|nr:hypothetical protein M408DRAFT_24928 [Serendipita vermifera MAFF 305830]